MESVQILPKIECCPVFLTCLYLLLNSSYEDVRNIAHKRGIKLDFINLNP